MARRCAKQLKKHEVADQHRGALVVQHQRKRGTIFHNALAAPPAADGLHHIAHVPASAEQHPSVPGRWEQLGIDSLDGMDRGGPEQPEVRIRFLFIHSCHTKHKSLHRGGTRLTRSSHVPAAPPQRPGTAFNYGSPYASTPHKHSRMRRGRLPKPQNTPTLDKSPSQTERSR